MFRAAQVALDPVENQVQRYLDSPIGEFSQPLEAVPPLVSAFRGSPIANFINSVQAEEAEISDHANLGPFVHLRPNAKIGEHVHCGNFVEIKNSVIGAHTAVSHLTYVGDSDVGKGVNFGCGVVTVNFNGKTKNRCTVGDDAFIGCNTNLIAPVKVGDRAYTAAGSTITHDVPDDSLAIARSRQEVKENWVIKKKPYREKKY